MLIRITERGQEYATREEILLDGRYSVISRSGLNAAEVQLIEALQTLSNPRTVLILGNRTGVSGIIASDLYPDAAITIHCLDLYYANKIKRNLSRNDVSSVRVRCEPFLEEKGNCDAAFLQVSRGGITKELLSDLLQETHQALNKGGQCFICVEGKSPWIGAQLKKLFGRFSVYAQSKRATCLVAKKKQDLKRLKTYQAEVTMTIPGKTSVKLLTIPGIFSHRRVDQGAQALAEVVDSEEGDAVLDMGCGCGAVGISIAKNQDVSRVCFVDSSSRATYITEKNCQINGLAHYDVVLADQGLYDSNEFTLFVGNPPYFSHYKISELFIRTAYSALRPKGRAYIVAKTAARHRELMQELFGNTILIKRRGYQIVKSIK